jgi:hypothetical protein
METIMNTDDFIEKLAKESTNDSRHNVLLKILATVVALFGISFLTLWFFVGIHPDFLAFIYSPVFWLRLGLLIIICISAMMMTWNLSQPSTQPRDLRYQATLSALGLIGVVSLSFIPGLPSEAQVIAQAHGWALAGVELGEDISIWQILLKTSATISLLAIPVFAALIWLMKRMAPTHPSLAGASAGFAASALAALEYSFNSPYDINAYSNLGYFICMALLPLLGAYIGKRWLHW